MERMINYLTDNGVDVLPLLKIKDVSETEKFSERQKQRAVRKLRAFFTKESYEAYSTDENEASLVIKPVLLKLHRINGYLKTEKNISFARSFSLSPWRARLVLYKGKTLTKSLLKAIAKYVNLPPNVLLDDALPLRIEDVKVDEEIYSLQMKEKEEEKDRRKTRTFFKDNLRILSYKMKVKLWTVVALVCIPLLLFSAFCTYAVVKDRNESIAKYESGSKSTLYDEDSATQTALYERLCADEDDPDSVFCNVLVGAELYKIYGIEPASSRYSAKMELFFDFDKEEFLRSFDHYAAQGLHHEIIADYEESGRAYGFASFEAFQTEEAEFYQSWLQENAPAYYPGQVASNVHVENNNMFTIGNGTIVPDTLSYVVSLQEYADANGRARCYQRVAFDATFNKTFDNIRYPLDSIQFKMYVLPSMDSEYIRYIPNLKTNADGQSLSGFSPYFVVSDGYRTVKESDDIQAFSLRLNYYEDVNTDPSVGYETTVRTQLEIVARANRHGVSLFLQAFVNLFSVVIWIVIAFYDQSYNGEDSIGMLGTGLFGVISSIIVGLSLMSDAGVFSLITMINVFTLAVIMVMTYQAIAAKRAKIKKDTIAIAYNAVKLRILFYVLLLTIATMFVCLPLLSYIFII